MINYHNCQSIFIRIFFVITLAVGISSCHKKTKVELEEPKKDIRAQVVPKKEEPIEDVSLKDQPYRPYANALTELKTHNLGDAKRWFSITITDFPKSDFAKMAKVMNIIILLSEELGNLRSLKYWNERSDKLGEVAEKNPFLEKGIEHDLLFFLRRADELGKELREASKLIKEADLTIEKFELSISLEEKYIDDLDDTTFITTLENATDYEAIGNNKAAFIEKQIIKNLFSFITEFFKVPLNKGVVNLIEAPIDYLVFLNALATRLYYISESMAEGNEKNEFINEARHILQIGKDLSDKDKYNPERLKILDLFKKIERQSR